MGDSTDIGENGMVVFAMKLLLRGLGIALPTYENEFQPRRQFNGSERKGTRARRTNAGFASGTTAIADHVFGRDGGGRVRYERQAAEPGTMPSTGDNRTTEGTTAPTYQLRAIESDERYLSLAVPRSSSAHEATCTNQKVAPSIV
jgi:hypothetical protein